MKRSRFYTGSHCHSWFGIRRGATRFVILIGNIVVKLPRLGFIEWYWRFPWGMDSNRFEVGWYKARGDSRLARILWADPFGLVVIMERLSAPPHGFKEKHLKSYRKEGRFGDLPIDPLLANIGMRGRKLVLIDYGMLPPPKEKTM